MRVFISHAGDGAELARSLAEGLRKEGLAVWLAQEEILPGDNWAEVTSQALKECQAMVVLFTPEAARSKNVLHEVGFALGSKSYRGRLLPVLLEPTDTVSLEAIPSVLQRYLIRLAGPDKVKEGVKEITHALLAAA